MAMIAAVRYRRDSEAPLKRVVTALSVLRPLSGAEDNTEANLRSIFEQDYPAFEVLLSVHEDSDPAAAVARKVMRAYPQIPSRLVVVGVSPLPNAKVWALRALLPESAHDTIVMTDSDVRLASNCLAVVASELVDSALVTCPYRAVGGWNFWSRLEALGLNTEFLAGMLTARMLNGMDYAIGCTIGTRKSELTAIGGLESLQRYLAEDFMMGNRVHRSGRKVVLSRSVIEHHIGGNGFAKNWRHRLRWSRSTRRSRGWAYSGELFTKTTAIGLLLLLIAPKAWGLVLIAELFRAGAAWFTGVWILEDPALVARWYLLPLEDLASFITWALGFFGKTIDWRGRKLILSADGTFEGA